MLFFIAYVCIDGQNQSLIDDDFNSIITRVKRVLTASVQNIFYCLAEVEKTDYSFNYEYLGWLDYLSLRASEQA